MGLPLALNGSGSQTVSHFIPSHAILDAQSLAIDHDLPLAHVFESAAALLSSIYSYSGRVTQAVFTLSEIFRQPSLRLEVGNVEVLSIEIDGHLNFPELARSVSTSTSPTKLPEIGSGRSSHGVLAENSRELLQVFDVLVCFYEYPWSVCAGSLDPDLLPQWANLLDRYSVCNSKLTMNRN